MRTILPLMLLLLSLEAFSQATLVKEINPVFHGAFYDIQPVVSNGLMYFAAQDGVHRYELWRTDGTTDGTFMVKDIGQDQTFDNYYVPYWLTPFGDKLAFVMKDTLYGPELWITDGTEAGTKLVADITPGPLDINSPSNLVVLNNQLFFTGDDGFYGNALWRTDGTEAGTVRIKEFTSVPSSDWYSEMVVFNNRLFFLIDDYANGAGLWVSDGTTDGTEELTHLGSGEALYNMMATSFGVFFPYNDDTTGAELWFSDGTAAGTHLVKDINPGLDDNNPGVVGPSSDNALEFKGRFYFVGIEETGNGSSLWSTDGTEAGTVMVKHLDGQYDGEIHDLVAGGDLLYFRGFETLTGRELYRTDGTTDGTFLVKDICPGSCHGAGSDVLPVYFNQRLYFPGNDSSFFDTELWVTDGTADSTYLLADVQPGYHPSWPDGLTLLDGELLFFASNNDVTDGLFKLTLPTVATYEQADQALIQVRPNPTGDFAKVQLPGDGNTTSQLLLRQLDGRLVQSWKTSSSSADLDLTGLPAGLYLLQIRQGQASYQARIMVVR